MSQKKHIPFSHLLFARTIAFSLCAVFAIFQIALPGVVMQQFAMSISSLACTIVGMILCYTSLVEYLLHRYGLHAPLIPGCTQFWRKHERHHFLTRVTRKGGLYVENVFPIENAGQYEASFFPWYTYGIFAAVSTPLFALMQWLLPHAPILLGGYLAIAIALVIYEVVHAVEHWPLERLQSYFKLPWIGSILTKAYSFHLQHHANSGWNESISGFFLIPVWDIVFRTYRLPKTLLADGTEANTIDFMPPRPRALIAWFDEKARASKSLA